MNERIGLLGIYGMEFALCIPCPPTDNDLSLSLHPQFLIAARRSNSFSAASTTATARGTPFRPGVSLTPWSSNREFASNVLEGGETADTCSGCGVAAVLEKGLFPILAS